MSERTTLRERQQLRARADLIAATLATIERGGIDAATIDAITTEAGVARTTLYAHFPAGRDEVLRAAYAALGERLLERAAEAAASTSTWEGRILSYARTMLTFSSDGALGEFYTLTGAALARPEASRGVGGSGYLQVFHEALLEAQISDRLDPAVDVDATAVLLAGSLRDAGIDVARGARTIEGFVDALARLIRGLSAAASHTG